MRIGDVLSKQPLDEYKQVDGFLINKKGKIGQQVTLTSCNIALNYYCKKCGEIRTFCSKGNISCIFENKNLISIDCILSCICGCTVRVWFLVECKNDITSTAPEIRIIKKSEKFSKDVAFIDNGYGEFCEDLENAKRAAKEGFGAGSIVYLRKVFEKIITQTAENANPPIETRKANGNLKPFIQILGPVKDQCNIIPSEFAEDGYKLFGDLSDVVHGEYNEDVALQKFDAFYRLVTGVLEKIKTNRELMDAIGTLGWHTRGEENE